MDAFQINAYNQKLEGGSIYHEAFALMGYLANNGNFLKRTGFMLATASKYNDTWVIKFLFQNIAGEISVFSSHDISISEHTTIKSICESIADIENSGFRFMATNKLIGLHFDDMSKEFKRKVKIHNILND
jgi:hypothetical protein